MPLNTIANCSLMTVRYMDRYGATEGDFAEIAVRMRANGALNDNAHLRKPITVEDVLASPLLTWPVRVGTSCPRSSGAAATVIASADVADRMSGPPAWIRAMTARTDTYFMGDRMGVDGGGDEFIAMDNLRLATLEAFEMAGIKDPVAELDVVEPYVPFSSYEPMMLEAMQLAPAGRAIAMGKEGAWDIGGAVAVSPSGGVMCSNPIGVTALVRVAEAAQQVTGRSGGHQVDGARVALATGAGGDSQFYGVAIISVDDPRA
jgi:acetyl-CoA C-acetyltransferase